MATAIPKVTIVKHARYLSDDTSGDASSEVDILARIEKICAMRHWPDSSPKGRRPLAP